MSFLLSKIFGFLVQPYVWISIFMVAAVFTSGQRSRRFLKTATLLIILFSNAFIVDEIIRMWETEVTKKANISPNIRTAVVLGGGLSYDEKTDRVIFGGGADRYLQALEVLESGRIDQLVISGGTGNVTGSMLREADLAKRFFVNAGVEESRLFIERDSRNTHENAVNSALIISQENLGDTVLLITSAFHMRRARACFQKEGLTVQTYSTGHIAVARKYNLEHLLVPHQRNLGKWDLLLHELIGWLGYSWSGWV